MADDEEIRITLRLPARLRDQLADKANENVRSMNGEIISRLDASFLDHVIIPPSLFKRIAARAIKNEKTVTSEVLDALENLYPSALSPIETLMETLVDLEVIGHLEDNPKVMERIRELIGRHIKSAANGGDKDDPKNGK